MKTGKEYIKIMTDETLRETVSHGSVEFPFRYYLEDIWEFDLHCVDWHWHPELEFLFLEKGCATFLIGDGRYELKEGTGIFINSQVIHRFEAQGHAVIPNIVFSPSLLASEGSLLDMKYLRPVLISSLNCLIFFPNIPWQKELLDTLLSVFALQESEKPDEFQTVQRLMKLWNILYRHLPIQECSPAPASSAGTYAQLQVMLQYIHANYRSRITLDDIAGTVMLSKSSILHIFGDCLHTSPICYLIDYRLKCAAKLLRTTDSSISFIAQASGFENTGYFCRKFKKLFQLTPGEYRKAEQHKRLQTHPDALPEKSNTPQQAAGHQTCSAAELRGIWSSLCCGRH